MKFSIITVCMNAEKTIGDTIRTVLEQTCTDVEYIVKDGGSMDETVCIAKSFVTAFEERGISYQIISKPDRGIYDAMNQAVREAKGGWVLYMNAGDLFADRYVLEMVEQSGMLETSDIVCYNGVGSEKFTASELYRCPNLSYNEDVLRERSIA